MYGCQWRRRAWGCCFCFCFCHVAPSVCRSLVARCHFQFAGAFHVSYWHASPSWLYGVAFAFPFAPFDACASGGGVRIRYRSRSQNQRIPKKTTRIPSLTVRLTHRVFAFVLSTYACNNVNTKLDMARSHSIDRSID
jgi:hypothetical protein